MKVSVVPGVIDLLCDLGPYSPDFVPQLVGLSEKTLRALDKGGLYKVETVHQVELALSGFGLEGAELGRELHVWTTKADNWVASGELYTSPPNLDGVTEAKFFAGERYFAISLSSMGFTKLIIDQAQNVFRRCVPEKLSSSVDPFKEQRLLAFDNYLSNVPNLSARGIQAKFEFTIHDDLLPLTKSQANHVKLLNEIIDQLIEESRQSNVSRSSSLIDEMARSGIGPSKKALMNLVAKLKRLKINVLACTRLEKIRLMDDSYGHDSPDLYGIRSDEYVTTFYTPLTHIVLAPEYYLRIPFPLPEPKQCWEPEPMWGSKQVVIGAGRDVTDRVEGLGVR